jgi:hypothetical protein
VTHRAVGADASARDLVLDREAGTWTLQTAEASPAALAEGSWEELADGPWEGFLRFDGDDGRLGVEVPGRHLLTPPLDSENPFDLGWFAATGADTALLRPLATGRYTLLRIRESAPLRTDLGFLELDEDGSFRLELLHSEDTRLDLYQYGDVSVDAQTADDSGTWTLGSPHPESLALDGAWGRWEGVSWPGWALSLRSPDGDGFWVGFFCPDGHLQLPTFDGLHRMLEMRVSGAQFLPPQPATVDIFGPEGLWTRRDPSGELIERLLGNRFPVSYVGNVAIWEYEDESALFMVRWDGFSAYFQMDPCHAPAGQPCVPEDPGIQAVAIGVQTALRREDPVLETPCDDGAAGPPPEGGDGVHAVTDPWLLYSCTDFPANDLGLGHSCESDADCTELGTFCVTGLLACGGGRFLHEVLPNGQGVPHGGHRLRPSGAAGLRPGGGPAQRLPAERLPAADHGLGRNLRTALRRGGQRSRRRKALLLAERLRGAGSQHVPRSQLAGTALLHAVHDGRRLRAGRCLRLHRQPPVHRRVLHLRAGAGLCRGRPASPLPGAGHPPAGPRDGVRGPWALVDSYLISMSYALAETVGSRCARSRHWERAAPTIPTATTTHPRTTTASPRPSFPPARRSPIPSPARIRRPGSARLPRKRPRAA